MPSAAVRKAGVPYCTAVKVDSTVQPGRGSCCDGVRRARAGLGARVDEQVPARHDRARRRGGDEGDRWRARRRGVRARGAPSHAAPTRGKAAIGSAPVRRGKAIGWTLLLGLVAWALVGRGLVNYDTLYALVWGRDLTHGTLPDYDVSLAPTPHPLATLAGAVLSVLGAQGSIDATIVLAFVFLGALGWVTYRLGEAWINRAAGALAAAIVLTRRPVLDFGARAYVDVPYLALVLGALLVETRSRRAGAPVLALLGLAGLIRPEAWLFSGAYLIWLWIGGVRDPRLWALAAAAPLLWALGDLIVTGDPLHSLTGTRDTAQRLQRITGLDEVPGTVPRRLGEILREPVLFGAAGGGVLALAFLRTRVALGAVAGVIALVAFCVLAAAGLPILGRYLLAPATILAIFCGAGAFGWAELPRGHPWRRRWAWFGARDPRRPRRLHPTPGRRASATCATRCASRTGSRTTCTRSRRASPARRSRCPTTARCRCWRCGSTSTPRGSRSRRSSGRAAAPTWCRRAGASRASTSSTRATSTRASRRRPPASGPSGPTRRGAPSRQCR